MTSINAPFRHARAQPLAESLQAARTHTLALFDCFAVHGLDVPARVPHLATINPPLWELGHIAWFAEWFILREAMSSHPAEAQRHSLLTRGDDCFDSNTVPHRARWTLDLPSAGALKTYCHEVLDRTLDKLSREAATDAALYPYRLALAHEDMHGEALLITLQTLGVPVPVPLSLGREMPAASAPGSAISYPGGTIVLGGAPQGGFVFDNEQPPLSCYVAPFRIDCALVTNAQYGEFITDGGYQDRRFWSVAGSAWLMRQERSSPRYWQREGEQWRTLRFGQPSTLAGSAPVRHVCLYEAQAYCAWAGRRLPTETEWETAAVSSQAGFSWGQLWSGPLPRSSRTRALWSAATASIPSRGS